jgi:DNA-binding NarL/FixJ family response regulator
MAPYNISIISPFPVVSTGLEKILGSEPDFNIGGIANDYSEAITLVEKGQDIIVAGIAPGVWGGPLFIEDIRGKSIKSCMLVCSQSKSLLYANACLKAGAQGYVLASEPAEEIVRAVHIVLQSGEYFSDPIPRVEMETDKHFVALSSFTDQEKIIFELMGLGYNNSRLQDQLNIQPDTVKAHKKNIRRKLRVGGKDLNVLAVQYAHEHIKSGYKKLEI